MPRRIPDYPDAYAQWNYISSLGSIISVAATVLFIYICYDIFANNNKNTNDNNEYSISNAFYIENKDLLKYLV